MRSSNSLESAALPLLIIVLVVLIPLARRRREAELARRLEATRDPLSASFLVDAAMADNKREGALLRFLRDYVWPFFGRH